MRTDFDKDYRRVHSSEGLKNTSSQRDSSSECGCNMFCNDLYETLNGSFLCNQFQNIHDTVVQIKKKAKCVV